MQSMYRRGNVLTLTLLCSTYSRKAATHWERFQSASSQPGGVSSHPDPKGSSFFLGSDTPLLEPSASGLSFRFTPAFWSKPHPPLSCLIPYLLRTMPLCPHQCPVAPSISSHPQTPGQPPELPSHLAPPPFSILWILQKLQAPNTGLSNCPSGVNAHWTFTLPSPCHCFSVERNNHKQEHSPSST